MQGNAVWDITNNHFVPAPTTNVHVDSFQAMPALSALSLHSSVQPYILMHTTIPSVGVFPMFTVCQTEKHVVKFYGNFFTFFLFTTNTRSVGRSDGFIKWRPNRFICNTYSFSWIIVLLSQKCQFGFNSVLKFLHVIFALIHCAWPVSSISDGKIYNFYK